MHTNIIVIYVNNKYLHGENKTNFNIDYNFSSNKN